MQQKISINQTTYDKIKILATHDYRSITKELEYIISFYEEYLLTPYPAQFIRPGSPNPYAPYPHYNDPTDPAYTNPADPLTSSTTSSTSTSTPQYATTDEDTISQDNTILNSRIIEYEQHMGDPDNEYYQKIKKYFTHDDPDLLAFNTLLNFADDNNFPAIADEYDYAIKKALNIPLTYEISRSEWKEIVGYLR